MFFDGVFLLLALHAPADGGVIFVAWKEWTKEPDGFAAGNNPNHLWAMNTDCCACVSPGFLLGKL